jgi:hypothetical protein
MLTSPDASEHQFGDGRVEIRARWLTSIRETSEQRVWDHGLSKTWFAWNSTWRGDFEDSLLRSPGFELILGNIT